MQWRRKGKLQVIWSSAKSMICTFGEVDGVHVLILLLVTLRVQTDCHFGDQLIFPSDQDLQIGVDNEPYMPILIQCWFLGDV